MRSRVVCCWLAAAATIVLLSARAQTQPQTQAQTPPKTRAEPEVKHSIVEDDKVRIEELRVRGQVQRITVSPKASGVRPYEIVPPDPGRDASQNKGLSGQRLWQFFSF